MVEESGLEQYNRFCMLKYGTLPTNNCWLCEYESQFVEEMGMCIHGEEDGFWMI